MNNLNPYKQHQAGPSDPQRVDQRQIGEIAQWKNVGEKGVQYIEKNHWQKRVAQHNKYFGKGALSIHQRGKRPVGNAKKKNRQDQ